EREELLGSEVPVHELRAEEHRRQRREREAVEDQPLLQRRKVKCGHVAEDFRQPGAPDKELQKHHYRKLHPSGHDNSAARSPGGACRQCKSRTARLQRKTAWFASPLALLPRRTGDYDIPGNALPSPETTMRIDFYGMVFQTPRVTFHLWSPWRATALEHR